MIIREITKIRITLLSMALVIAALSFSACSKERLPEKIYVGKDFSAEICWHVEDSEYRARLEVRYHEDRENDCNILLEMTSPQRLRGIRIEKQNGEALIKVGDMTAELHNQAILNAAELLLSNGNFSYKARAELAGRAVIVAERVNGGERAEVYIDAESGAPVCVICGERRVDVVWFEYID